MLKGIDISKWQGQVNFDLLRNSVQFVIIRSSYGVGYKDAQFDRNRDEARRCNLPRGFYHYAYPNNNSPEAEADYFLSVIGAPQKGEILCLDFEEQYSNPVDWSLKFLDRVSARLGGYKPLLYINISTNNSFDWKPVVDANYGLWLARWDYNINAVCPTTDWPVVAMRQYSNKETFPGITGVADADVFYGEELTFKAYGYNPPPDNPTPDPYMNTSITLLKEFQEAHSDLYSNLESATRGAIGAFNDLTGVKQDFATYKENEAEHDEQLVIKTKEEVKAEYTNQLLSDKKLIEDLQALRLSELPWGMLLSWGFRNMWKAKRT